MIDRWHDCDAFESRETALQINDDIKKRLAYSFHPLYDWRPVANQHLQTISVSPFRLRCNNKVISHHNINALVLGGSFAWGYGASSNDNIPSQQIENTMNKKIKKDVRVFNLADQWYNSLQEIKSFVFSVDDFKPSYIFCITGYNDVSNGWRCLYKWHFKYNEITEFMNWGISSGLINAKTFIKKMYKFFLHYRKLNSKIKENCNYQDIHKDIGPEKLIDQKIDILRSYCERKNIKIAFILQPMSFIKKNKSEYEEAYTRKFDNETIRYYNKKYEILKNKWITSPISKQCHFIDTTPYTNSYEKTFFLDNSHSIDAGYRYWTNRLCEDLDKVEFFNEHESYTPNHSENRLIAK